MFKDAEVMSFCLRYKISVRQYFFLYMLARKDFHRTYEESLCKRYLQEIGKFSVDEIRDLIDKDFIEDFNSPGQMYPEMYMLNENALKLFVTEDMAEELWDNYPATLPLSGGSSFVARAGGDKDEILAEYRKRIDYSGPKHRFVMKQLANYKDLVKSGKINGHKISDWIKMEVWDAVGDMLEEENETSFGQDI